VRLEYSDDTVANEAGELLVTDHYNHRVQKFAVDE
jgi:hypothetical protein